MALALLRYCYAIAGLAGLLLISNRNGKANDAQPIAQMTEVLTCEQIITTRRTPGLADAGV